MLNTRKSLLLVNFLLVAVYFLSGRLGLMLAFEQANTSPVWPPTGIAVAAILYFGYRAAPGVFLGAILVNASIGLSVAASALIAIGNSLEALAAAYLVIRFSARYPFSEVSHVFKFAAIVLFATSISASIGVTTLLALDLIEVSTFGLLWYTWWLGDAAGALVLTPFLLTWARPQDTLGKPHFLQIGILVLVSLACSAMVFGKWIPLGTFNYPLAFLFLPLLIFAAHYLGQHGATLYVVVLSLFAIYGTLMGYGPFVQAESNESLLHLQGFMAVIGVTGFAIAASMTEQQRARERVQAIHLQLEDEVEKRTDELKQSNLELQNEMQEGERSTLALRTLLAATGLATDEEFFRASVKDLADIYQTRYAFFGVYTDEKKTSIRTIAVWAGDKFAENFTYDLEGTPCQDVLNLDMELVPNNAASLYPQDQMLTDMEIESYFGGPLISPAHSLIGIVAVMDSKALSLKAWVKPVLGIFANRLAMELERRSFENELKLAESVFSESIEAIVITNPDKQIVRVNPAFTRVTGFSAKEAIGKTPNILKSGYHDEHFYTEFMRCLEQNGSWQGEMWDKKKNGEIFPVWQTVKTVRNYAGEIIQYFSIFGDITEKKKSEERIYHLAHFDVLTNLPNRVSFLEQLEKRLLLSRRHNSRIAILFLDLDHFKLINDTSGHSVGDTLLQQVALRLQQLVQEDDTVARLGGDEFTILLSALDSVDEAALVAEQILSEFTQPFVVGETELVISPSIGISSYPDDGLDASTLLKSADTAMYRAKERGRNNFQFYTMEMNERAQERHDLEKAMRKGLERNEFILHYQPQVNAITGEIVGCEALVRWMHPEQGLIPPNVFIPVAEETGLITPLGEWVIDAACQQYALWQQQGIAPRRVAVNLSGRQLMHQQFASSVEELLQKHCVDPKHLELELTESMIMENVEETIKILQQIRAMGIHLSIDDFGTGYSSMAYIKRFPIDKIKIDQSFVRDIATDSDDAAIVTAIIAIANNLKLSVIAEGVETEEQLKFLRAHGCELIQGYYFSRPLAHEQITEVLIAKRCL